MRLALLSVIAKFLRIQFCSDGVRYTASGVGGPRVGQRLLADKQVVEGHLITRS